MALDLIPYPLSILFALALGFACTVILWKMRKRAKIFSLLFYVVLVFELVLALIVLYLFFGPKYI